MESLTTGFKEIRTRPSKGKFQGNLLYAGFQAFLVDGASHVTCLSQLESRPEPRHSASWVSFLMHPYQ